MKATVTLNAADIREALELLCAKRGLRYLSHQVYGPGEPDPPYATPDPARIEVDVEIGTPPKGDPRIREVVTVSGPDAALEVQEIQLTEEGRRGLEIGRREFP